MDFPKRLRPQIPWKRLFAQGAVLTTSILAALASDAWWEGRKNDRKEHAHLLALTRDFGVAQERVALSEQVARDAKDEIFELFMAIEQRTTAELGRGALLTMIHAVHYEVFSSPRGAYDAMVSSGQVRLLKSHSLKQLLADFYGGIEDTRVSEQQLLRLILAFQMSEVFATKINWAELGNSAANPDLELGDRLKAMIASWSGDPILRNWLCTIMAHQDTVAEDYIFLAERIDAVVKALELELR
ncbi:MAG: hypothetical protein ACI8QC_002589 [Planctomycetota bacterium]|jgi:hypothetical protein